MLVLCDHERAGATVPATLVGVLDQQAGSARAVLAALLRDPGTRALRPAPGHRQHGRRCTRDARARCASRCGSPTPSTADTLRIVRLDEPGAVRRPGPAPAPTRLGPEATPTPPGRDDDAAYRLEGRWSSRQWVGHVTRLLTGGGTQVLVGTRGLLGEGWDARCITRPGRPHHRHLADGRGADPRPRPAHRPDLAGQGRGHLVGDLRQRPPPARGQRLAAARAQAHRLPRRRRGRHGRRRGRPPRRRLLAVRPAAGGGVRRPSTPG